MQSPHPKLSEREIAESWAKIIIQLWRKDLTRMNIGQNYSGDLNRSFKYKVIAGPRENVGRIKIAFNITESSIWIPTKDSNSKCIANSLNVRNSCECVFAVG